MLHTTRINFLINVALITTLAILSLPAESTAASIPPSLDPTFNLPAQGKSSSYPQVNWIWAEKTSDNQNVWLRRTFRVTTPPIAADLYINADDSFTLYVNGTEMKQTPPPVTRDTWEYTQKFDITSLLKPGVNAIAVIGHNDASVAGVAAALIADSKVVVLTDKRWQATTDQPSSTDWTDATFDDSGWLPASEIAPVGQGLWSTVGALIGWPFKMSEGVPYLAHIDLPFVSVSDYEHGDGRIDNTGHIGGNINQAIVVTPAWMGSTESPGIVLDFGKEIAGRVVIVPLTAGKMIVSRGESNEEATDGPWHGPVNLTLTPGTDSATDYSAFRYVGLSFPPVNDPTKNQVKFRIYVDHKYYPVKYLGSFSCSDPLLTKIWYTGAYTSHLCMQEDIWDAPKRDRARWVGDLHVSGEVINNVFADKFLMEQTLNRLRDDAGNGDVNGIPGYSCAWICCLADLHRHIGDYVFLNSQHDRLISLLEHLRGDLDSRGIVKTSQGSWMYTDWSPGFDGDSALSEAATHLFLTRAVKESVFLLREMGDSINADKYSAWADALSSNARQYLADSATNTYGNRLQENAMAIYSGVATDAQTASIYQAVLDPASPSWNRDGKLLGDKPVMSPYYGNYILLAMGMAGHTEGALSIIRSFWGGMIAEGATTFWEAYDPNWPKTNYHKYLQADDSMGYFVSLCHGWSSGPTSFLTERVLGIRPTGGGFKSVDIAPDLADLSWAEGGIPTPRGILHVRIEKTKGVQKVTVILPPDVNADVKLTGSQPELNGREVPEAESQQGGPGHDTIHLTKSGTYVIKTKI